MNPCFLRAARLLVILLCFSLPSATAAEYQVDVMRDNYFTVAKNYRNALRPYLSESERAVLGDIQFVYLPIPVLNAAAYIENGQRKIAVTYGWLLLASELSIAASTAMEFDKPQCFARFLSEVSEIIIENSGRYGTGRPLTRVPLFYGFVTSNQAGPCKGLGLREINDPKVLRMVSARMNCATAWLFGHEIAHHVNGDVGRNIFSLAQSRQVEASADKWSIQRAFDIKINPLLADAVLLLYAIIGATDHEGELRSTHPASIRRYVDFLDAIEEKMKDTAWYHKKFGVDPPQGAIESIDQRRRQAEALIPAP